MFQIVTADGTQAKIELSAGEIAAMAKTGNPVAEINKRFKEADLKIGSAFDQMKASVGLIRPGKNNPFGLRPSLIGDVLSGNAGLSADTNTQKNTIPFGDASRAFVNVAIISEVLAEIQKDRTTDAVTFDQMVAQEISIDSEHFEQPVIEYRTTGGPEQAKATRVVQGAEPTNILFFSTSDRIRRIGSWNIGMQWTDQALRNTTLDYVTMTMAHYLQVERDERVYRYINDLFNGNGDLITDAVSNVTSTSLNGAATAGVLNHKVWLKWLARNRKYRKITHVICDLDTYLKIEGRTGRPGTTNYDPTLARIDPQTQALNVGFGNDVKFFLVDSAADGGPVPANTIYGIDASKAIGRVVNTGAAYQSTEAYAMKRMTAMRLDWSEEVIRLLGDSELRAFDVLTID